MPALVFDKCCGCIDLKTGCFIIGYLNLIGTLIMAIMAIVGIAGGALAMQNKEHEGMHEAGLFVVVMACIMLILVLLALVFVIALLVGLHKNKPGHIKAYLIYSVIFLVITIVRFIIGCTSSTVDAGGIVETLLTILLSIYFLLVIRSQYYRMKDPSRGPAIYSAA